MGSGVGSNGGLEATGLIGVGLRVGFNLRMGVLLGIGICVVLGTRFDVSLGARVTGISFGVDGVVALAPEKHT